MTDISFQMGHTRFNVHVGAIIEHNHKYLLTTVPDINFWVLPGGRLKAGESSLEAITRELEEEIEDAVQAVQLRWVVENFYRADVTNFHEISYYFSAQLAPKAAAYTQNRFVNQSVLIFEWFDLAAILSLDLRPAFIESKLPLAQSGFEHIVFRDTTLRRSADLGYPA